MAAIGHFVRYSVSLGPFAFVAIVIAMSFTVAAGEKPSAYQLKFFEAKVRPVLAANCVRCHGSTKQRGDLRLDTLAAMMKGGESGPALSPGNPKDSLIIEAINHESLEMPPDGKLKDDEIAAITEWVRIGAPWPENAPRIAASAEKREKPITDADRAYWAFQPVKLPNVTEIKNPDWSRNEIDRFIGERHAKEGLESSPTADRRTLIRRVYFDLLGVPPLPEEVQTFLADDAVDAYDRLVDRLLADPRYGERWARHWLDLVRYAESDGFKQDEFRPHAWRYRDYVIRALNSEKPYDRFVQEQLAGDEIAPGDNEALIATGYLRHWIYEYNQRDVRTQWANILNDVTDVTADVFLGMGMQCARCHDHKFDPILQRDYFRLQAFLAPMLPRDDMPLATPEELAAYHAKLDDWLQKTADIRREIDAIEKPFRKRVVDGAVNKFPKDIRPMLTKERGEREPFEQQLAELAYRQVNEELEKLKVGDKLEKLKDTVNKEKLQALKKRLAEYEIDKPQPMPPAFAVTDVGPQAPTVFIPSDREKRPIPPGFLTILDAGDAAIDPPASNSQSTGRRTALARWLTDPKNPLTTRVIVNRIWQYHFGTGLALNSSDFGKLGEPPSHPELLDWLTSRFLSSGWEFKPMHRRIVTSATYQQKSHDDTKAGPPKKWQLVDPDNRLLSHMPIYRLEAEQIRDAMLITTGELNMEAGGPSVERTETRRTIYTRVLRNNRDPLLDVFDAPDNFTSASDRNVTTTPTQALLMINGPFTLARAKALSARLRSEFPSWDTKEKEAKDVVQRAFWLAFNREPTASELESATAFLTRAKDRKTALVDFCHVLLNANEFLYVD